MTRMVSRLHPLQLALAVAAWGLGTTSLAQQRPDSGTLQEPQRLLPALPAPGGPGPNLPVTPSATPPAATVRIIPTEFRFEGNSLFDAATLAALLAPRLNQPTDLAGLQEAARLVRAYYVDRGHLLTDVFIPQQALRAGGGPVTFGVLEARVGQVVVRTQGTRISQATAESLARRHLAPGAPITADSLDKPVLLLRDLPGYNATATVEPGTRPGESNIILDVREGGRPVEVSVGADNHGTRAAGSARVFASIDLNNPGGRGDALNARLQVAELSETRLFRLSYTMPSLGSTRLSLAATRTEYALGKQFAALGARGHADVMAVSALHPLLRARDRNLFMSLGLEHKRLNDATLVSASTQRKVASWQAGLLGNATDQFLGNAFTSYAARLTAGHVALDDATRAIDQAAGGANTAGTFHKFNLEVQRAQFWSNRFSLNASLQAQLASRNLTSAEKMSLGGPAGVRGYPVGEGVGDSGAMASLELRYQLPPVFNLAGEPVSVGVFYDTGSVRINQEPSAAATQRVSLDSAGLALLAGRVGNFVFNTSIAQRIGSPLPSSGEPDRSPRFWLTTQKWF